MASYWRKVSKAQAVAMMGLHAAELEMGESMLRAEKRRDVSYCVPTTGKSLWARRRGAVISYHAEG